MQTVRLEPQSKPARLRSTMPLLPERLAKPNENVTFLLFRGVRPAVVSTP